MKAIAAVLAFFAGLGALGAYHANSRNSSTGTPNVNPFSRQYREGEKISYHMKATNKDRLKTMSYEAQADGVVKKDAAGHFYEEYQWSGVVWDGRTAQIPADFRQILSLDLKSRPQLPDLQHAGSALVGPTLDLFSFYSDLIIALQQPGLKNAGDHTYVKLGGPNSWAAGEGLILGEDSIDFDLTVQSIDRSAGVATLLVRHVPPPQPQIHTPAAWMQTPVVDEPNNWVEVGRNQAGKYVASIGKETFDDVIRVSLADGHVLSATMDNPVEVSERECEDAALTVCGAPIRYQIRRQIAIQ
ncbi:MAG TPA: hypothetical protein VKB26_10250 [Candidatus Acidoferrales bacterium]|nr:hypothetical protein [Candidatus Acidoferrales bacterium]